METTAETTLVQREISITASPETVWEFLVDPEKMTRWMGTSATLDPRPGGVYLVDVIPGATARGEFVELDPPHRMVFTFGWEGADETAVAVPPGSTTIEIELVPDGEGTLLRFHHDLPTVSEAAKHGHGWDHYLGRLAIAAGGGNAGEDPWQAAKP